MRPPCLRILSCVCFTLFVTVAAGAARALPVSYTDSAAFFAAIAGSTTTLDFDSETAGSTIASGGTAGGITFTYAFGGGEQLQISNAFLTTSSPNFLGSDSFDLLASGDDFGLAFAAANAVGLFVISADPPGYFLFDGDLSLTAGGGTALLDVDDPEQQLLDGAFVYFLGIVDADATFSTASLATNGAGSFFYNVDDIVTGVVPEPSTLVLVSLGLLGLGGRRRAR